MRTEPPVFGPRAARAKLNWPVTLTTELVQEAEVFSKPSPSISALRAAMPAVVELGRSKDGPPVLVVMQPGLRVEPPVGKASKDEIVVLFSAAPA